MISLSSPVRTRAHDWSEGFKLLALCIVTAVLFAIENVTAQLAALLFVAVLYALPGRLFLVAGIRQLRILWPFVLIVGVWHAWTGEYALGASVILRMLATVGLANLVTMTTRLDDMIDVVKTIASPLQKVGLNARVLEIAIALVIRLTPTLIQKGGDLTQAWKARSPKKPNWRIILPFTVLALDDADHVAEALRARGGIDNLSEN